MKHLLNMLALVIVLLTAGCVMSTAEMRRVSMGRVACNPREMVIRNASTDRGGDASWTVTCEERSYSCARTMGSTGQAFMTGHRSESFSCTER